MRIGIDGHDLEGNRTGVGTYLINILRAWERAGELKKHDVVTFHKDEVPEDLPEGIRGVLLSPPLGRSSTAIFTHWQLPRAAKKESVDILFCPGYVIPLLWRGPSAVTLHDIIYEAHPEWFKFQSRADYLLLKRFSKSSAKRASVILTPSHFSAGEIMRYYSVDAGRIFVTPLAAGNEFHPRHDSAKEQKLLAKYGLSERFVLSFGTIQSRRHLPDAIAAFERLARNHPDLSYLIGGRNMTDPHVDIEGLIRNTNRALDREAIRYTNFIDQSELPDLQRAASALLWLSDYEGYGLPPIEAMACATPVITSDSTCLPETVGDCAILIKDNSDHKEIAAALEVLLNSKKQTSDLSHCGPKRAGHFSWESTASTTLDALRAATGEGEGSAQY